jgi:tetratricopeptide (TPR) repeat protein
VTVRLPRPLAAIAALSAAAALAPLDAQPARRPPRQDTPFMTVQVFRSADRVAGPQASDALRDRLIQVYPGPVLWVIEKERLVELLEQSGYPTNEQLARADENSLAKFQRADEYIRGAVTREADGQYRIDAQLVLTRDASLTQPLPPVRGARPDRTAWLLVRPIQDARRQLDNEKKCREHATNERYAEALAEADKAIEDYPNATLVRYCKLNVLVRQGATPAQQIALADEILGIDPNSRAALAVAADAHQASGNVEKANELLVRLLAGEPNNAALATRVVDALAASRQYDVAKQIVLQAVQDNPGDISLIRLKFLILTAAGDYKPAIATGEELITLDTAMADAQFYTRLTALYIQDSQPTMAVDAARRGTGKFPNDASLWQLYSQTLRTNGQALDALEASKRALQINPNIQNGWVLLAQGYLEQQQQDSAMAALRRGKDAGESADFIAAIASGIGNQLRIRGNEAKSLDTLRAAVALLQFSDTVAQLSDEVGPPDARRQRVVATPETRSRVKFILGAASVQLAQLLAAESASGRNCELAREADQALITAQINLPGGAAFNQASTVQLMQSIPEFQAYITQLQGQVCK